ELHGERGPSGLMTSAAAATGFAVEIFVKQNEIAPVWIIRVLRGITMTWARSFLVRQKDASQSARKFTRDLLQRHHVSRARRALNFERFTIKEVVTFERFDDQEISWEPNWTAPVRIPAKQIAIPFARNVVDPKLFVAGTKDIRLLVMDA